MEEINKIIEAIDKDGDGKVSPREIFDYSKMVAKEYIYLYIALIVSYISFYKPSTFADWKNVGMLSLIATTVILGGIYKRNFQRVFQRNELEKRDLEAEILVHKEALSKAAAENQRLRAEIDWYKSQFHP